ncbi:MAG: Bax inhibitor-1 family protein [Myxococcales bacterium]|nr:Bax inhibitor-1/YccA family protein [Myxococcales bacterium]MCB9752843.1 Bax inhibitor-1 family protein [Myxococcales bacterium]
MAYSAADAPVEERAKFIERTYLHLAGAIAAFVGLEAIFLNTPAIVKLGLGMLQSWWLVLILFMGVGWIAERWAQSGGSKAKQYLGLALYVVLEAFIFVPLLFIAQVYAAQTGDAIIVPAGVSTLAIFAALTGFVMFTKRDFSWMRGVLAMVTLGAIGLIFASMIFGFGLGVIFTVAMVVLAACYILYYTSNVLHHYRTDQHVAAALALFSAVALLFWYIIQLFMSRD